MSAAVSESNWLLSACARCAARLERFFNFARKKNYLPSKLNHSAHALEPEETISEAREVWDPEHLRRALESVAAHDPEWLPWLTLSTLVNIRSMGARRLPWSDVHWHDRLLELKARSSTLKKRVTITLRQSCSPGSIPTAVARG
jgi:hypothetical protein